MEALLKQLLIVVMVTAFGFTARKTNFVGENVKNTLSVIAIRLALPFMVFSTVINSANRESLISGLPIMLFSVCVITVLILIGLGLSSLLRMKGKLKLLYSSMFICDNAGFLGIPLCLSVFAGDSVIMFGVTMFFIADILMVWSIGYYFITGGSDGGRFEPKRMLSPASIALIAGIAWVLLGLPTEHFLLAGIAGLGDSAKYLALLYIGCAMTDLNLKKALSSISVYIHIAVRMLTAPVLTYIAATMLGIMTEGQARGIALMIGMPLMSSFPMLAHEGNNNPDVALQAALLTMFVSPITITIVFWVIDMLRAA